MPAKMGTSASARTVVITWSSRLCPLCLQIGPCGASCLAHLASALGVEPITKIGRARARIANCPDQLPLHLRDGGRRWPVGILDMQHFVQQAEFCEVADVIRHGRDLVGQTLQVSNGSK